MSLFKSSLTPLIAGAILVLGSLAALNAYQHYQILVEQQLSNSSVYLNDLLSATKTRLENDFLNQNLNAVEQELFLLKHYEPAELCVLVDNEGIVRFSSSFIVLNQPIDGQLQILDQAVYSRVQTDKKTELIVSPQQQAIFAYVPVNLSSTVGVSNNAMTGILFVEWNLAPEIAQIRGFVMNELFTIWLMLVLTLAVVLYILRRYLLQPLAKLNQSAIAMVLEEKPMEFEFQGVKPLNEFVSNINQLQQIQNKYRLNSQHDNQRWRFAIESAGDCVQDWHIAADKCFFSHGFYKLLELTEEDELDWSLWKKCIDQDWDMVDRKLKRHLQGLSDLCQVEYSVRLPGGKSRVVIMRGRVVERSADGTPLRMVASHRDITARRRMEDALRNSEERYRKLFEMAQEGIWQIDAEGKTLLVNDAMANMLGYHAQEMTGRLIREFLENDSRKAMEEKLSRMGQGVDALQEFELVSKAGVVVYTTMHWSPVYDIEGDFEGMIAGVMDVSERRRAEERIKQQALFDELTKLPNRRMLNERLDQEQARAMRHGHKGALLFIDLDHFKNVNDSLGHPVGDSLLVTIAGRLSQVLRTEDTLARLGGDEFVVLLPELHSNASRAASLARNVALKIQDCMSDVLEVHGYKLNVGCSIGIALYPLEQESIHDIVKQADAAMYRAKDEGRNAICLFSQEMHQQIEDNLRLQMLLPGALEEEQFILYFQPQFNQRRELIGAEVLLRWEEPDQGFVRPELFIRAAEESGQIVPLGDWVIRKACQQLNEWRGSGLPASFERLAINISARQFAQDDFPYRVKAFVDESGLQPQDIELEITESMLLNKLELVIEKMHLLHDMGFHIALDDFGTGYSSLSYLHTLPLDKLKIDQAFIRDIDTDKADRAIVETIITMAKLMELDVIAEGVEQESQLRYLLSKGCNKFQGYYFAKPMPAKLFKASWLGPKLTGSGADQVQ